jgi:hypothetical protein
VFSRSWEQEEAARDEAAKKVSQMWNKKTKPTTGM